MIKKSASAASAQARNLASFTSRGKGTEIFDLTGHPKAKRCYAWLDASGPHNEFMRFVAVLEIPPVDSAVTAVRLQIVADTKKRH